MSLTVQLEDELGDVLEKALKMRSLTEERLAEESGVTLRKIKDAFDYRYDFSAAELIALAETLHLNEVGLNALAEECYPLPSIPVFPYVFRPYSLSLGSGKVNAYFVHPKGQQAGVLFDTGYAPGEILECLAKDHLRPSTIFITHHDSDHVGGLAALKAAYPGAKVLGPPGKLIDTVLKEGASQKEWNPLQIHVFDTCGHSERHYSYLVEGHGAKKIFIAGDLVFAGSIGGAFHCRKQLRENFNRMLRLLPPETVIAPGHGPLTTVANERRFNPFAH